MIKVIFVCLGNICRSPMAEGFFRAKVKEAGLDEKITASSAATGEWNLGNAPHAGTQEVLKKRAIDYTSMRATLLNAEDFKSADYIIAMDDSNIENIHRMNTTSFSPKILKLMDFVPNKSKDNVPDPYYTGDFSETECLIETGTKYLLEAIKKEHSL